MKIKLVFWKWKCIKLQRVTGSEMLKLETGVFHGGSTFSATIELSEEDMIEFLENYSKGYRPFFLIDSLE